MNEEEKLARLSDDEFLSELLEDTLIFKSCMRRDNDACLKAAIARGERLIVPLERMLERIAPQLGTPKVVGSRLDRQHWRGVFEVFAAYLSLKPEAMVFIERLGPQAVEVALECAGLVKSEPAISDLRTSRS